jgi:ABC-type glutathione transport system ATPase component
VTPRLEVAGLGIRFPIGGWPRQKTLRAAHDVHFSVAEGEIVALVGESGSGKSTIGRAIARLLPMDAGRITLHGTPDQAIDPGAGAADLSWRRRVQLIFQDPFASINPVYPVGHAVERALLVHGRATPVDVADKVAAALAAVGLEPAAELARRHPHQLSGGQRQRVSIARALATRPDLVVADEPTSMLDVSIRMGVIKLLAQLARERGLAILFITHDLASARYLAARLVVLEAGRVVETGDTAQVIERPTHDYTRRLLQATPRGIPRAAAAAADAGGGAEGRGS